MDSKREKGQCVWLCFPLALMLLLAASSLDEGRGLILVLVSLQ